MLHLNILLTTERHTVTAINFCTEVTPMIRRTSFTTHCFLPEN